MTLTFANHKGGTGKTTTVINIGKALADLGFKILLADFDPQGNLSYSLGLSDQQHTISDFLLDTAKFEEVACEASGMHIIPADLRLYSSENEIRKMQAPSQLLKKKLSPVCTNYDFIFIDCSPAFSLYTLMAFYAADGLVIPVAFDILSIQGMDQILQEIRKIKQEGHASLKIVGVLGVMVNENRKLTEEVLKYIRDHYAINIFNNYVRNNVKAAEAPSFGKSVLEYAPYSISSRDYKNVAKELLEILEIEPANF